MNARRYLRNIFHSVRLIPYLIKENSIPLILNYLLLTILDISREMQITISGTNLYLRSASTDLTVAVSCLRDKEFLVAEEFSGRLKNQFVIDAGGYIGTAAIAFSKMFPEATVVTLEPSEKNFQLLNKNIRSFPNIIAVNKALVGTDSKISLFDHGTGEWGFSAVQIPKDSPKTNYLHEIQGISIGSLLDSYNKSGVDILKMDIEGGEKDVLEHSQDWIHRVGMIIAELHERILSGCEQSFNLATKEMRNVKIEGEKVVSINDSYFPTE